ncbi:MAG TPA: VOC family protein [Kofleriaceae bacterium]|nr:VOC family protein [Kofleriaceae bacterium]
MKLGQAMIFVNDTGRMQAFYEALGLHVIDGDAADGFVRLADPAGGAILALHATKAADPGGPPRVDTAIKLCFQIDDVDRERAVLVARGVTMRDVHRFESIEFCDGIDPEGNIFQITTRS